MRHRERQQRQAAQRISVIFLGETSHCGTPEVACCGHGFEEYTGCYVSTSTPGGIGPGAGAERFSISAVKKLSTGCPCGIAESQRQDSAPACLVSHQFPHSPRRAAEGIRRAVRNVVDEIEPGKTMLSSHPTLSPLLWSSSVLRLYIFLCRSSGGSFSFRLRPPPSHCPG